MIMLREIDERDTELIASKMKMNHGEAKELIEQWKTNLYKGNFFEMLAVLNGDSVVGMISLYEHSKSVISIRPEIFEEYRGNGFGKKAMTEAIGRAKEKKYSVVLQQVRTNNTASIRLHESLGFEKDNTVYKNGKGNDVFLYLKMI